MSPENAPAPAAVPQVVMQKATPQPLHRLVTDLLGLPLLPYAPPPAQVEPPRSLGELLPPPRPLPPAQPAPLTSSKTAPARRGAR